MLLMTPTNATATFYPASEWDEQAHWSLSASWATTPYGSFIGTRCYSESVALAWVQLAWAGASIDLLDALAASDWTPEWVAYEQAESERQARKASYGAQWEAYNEEPPTEGEGWAFIPAA